jgi:hypothetical protein
MFQFGTTELAFGQVASLKPERSMSDPQPLAFPEADEQLFQKVRNELLRKAKDKLAANSAAPSQDFAADAGADSKSQKLPWLVAIWAVLGTIASVLGWLVAESFGTFRWVGLLVLTLIGVGLLASRLWQKASTRTAKPLSAAPPPALSAWGRLMFSLVAFVVLGTLVFPPVEIAWLIGVLLLHECGHYFGMRYFGYRDLQMFFIPFLGAAVRGEKQGVLAWQEAIVLLLGPVPGLILGCSIYFLDLAIPQPILRTGAAWLVAINFLNLLPFEPLDGGRFCNRLLFSRFRWLEAITLVLATVGLVFVCLSPGWICLALSAAFALFVLAPARYKTATAAAALQARWPALPPQMTDLSEEQWRDMFTITRGQFRSSTKLLPGQMKMVHTRALLHPESGTATFSLFTVYLAALLLGIVTASVTHLGEDTGRWPIGIKDQATRTVGAVPPPNN